MSNFDSNVYGTLFHFETLNEPLPKGHNGASGPCSHMDSFLRDIGLFGICSGFWKFFLGPFSNVNDRIMQMSDAVSSDCLKTTDIQQSSMKKKYFSNFSESFYDIMHCRWWYLQSLCNLTLRNVVFKVFHNLFTHSFTDWRPSAHLYLCETLLL